MFEFWDHIRSSNRTQALVIAALVLAALGIGTAMQSQKSESLAKELSWLREKTRPRIDPCWGTQRSSSWMICVATRDIKATDDPETKGDYLINRASAYIHLHRYDLALRDLDVAVAQKGISRRTLGIALVVRGGDKLALTDPAGAEPDFSLARMYLLRDERWSADYGRGWSRIELHKPEQALPDFSEALALLQREQNELMATVPQMLRYLSPKDQRDMKASWSASLSRAIARCYSARAAAFRALGRYNQSVSDYNLAIKINPSDLSSYSGRSLTEFAMGNWRAGFEDFWKHTKLVLNFGGKP